MLRRCLAQLPGVNRQFLEALPSPRKMKLKHACFFFLSISSVESKYILIRDLASKDLYRFKFHELNGHLTLSVLTQSQHYPN